MIARKLRAATLAIGATLGLAACTTYGDGYGGSAYSVGLGYYDGDYYGSPYYGYGYGPSYGWYDGFYYPGTGYYVFDRGGRRHAWNDRQRDYWRNRGRDRDGSRDGPRRPAWEGDRNLTPEARQARREAWQARRGQQGVAADPAAQAARREAWQARRQQRQADPAWQARREAWRAQRQQQGATTAPPRAERSFRGGGGNPGWRSRRGRND